MGLKCNLYELNYRVGCCYEIYNKITHLLKGNISFILIESTGGKSGAGSRC
jgi:hypothetical protein